ncbi:formyltetrahydrofolate deformylase [Phycisphaerales bacterium AB-hyl4]|uniref:Formyltetrahydrofolate deformylase n=1 Tax=Natronomicrosphaera hydrolytica TaxID=3242702 RepID=A0ABV4U7L1_9BACT
MATPVKAVVSVIGRDQKGVVARFATYLAEHGVNILDLEQQVAHGQFLMDMLVDLVELDLSLDELITGLLKLGVDVGMDVRVSLHDQRRRKRVAVLVSKEPHCLKQLIDDWQAGHYRGELVGVLGNHPDLEPVAKAAGLPFAYKTATDKGAHFEWMLEQLKAMDADLVVLARYMQIVPPQMVEAFRYKIINIHPSLLPYFPGARPYHQAWEQGVRVTGCTAHFVTEALDEGPIILQDVFHIDVGKDSASDVRKKGVELESRVLSQAVQMFLDEKLVVVEDKVVFRPGLTRFLEHAE